MTVRRISFKNSLFRAVFLLLTLLMLGCATARADALRAVRERGVLRVGATGDYRPMSFRDPATGHEHQSFRR